MGSAVLRPHLFMNAQTSAGTYGSPNLDYAYSEERNRSIFGVRTDANDIIQVLLEIEVPQYSNDGSPATSVVVTATATTFTSVVGTYMSMILTQPCSRIKIVKIGASGAATFVGII
jgi:hypothetical protein